MIAITGATGQLGRLVIDALLARVQPREILALVRDPAKAQDLAAKGVTVRKADYNAPETLTPALAGVTRLLLISSNEIGQRARQHGAVIHAGKAADLSLLAYTSVLHADTSPLGLAAEHLETEAALQSSGVPYALLRNGWYNENYAGSIAPGVAHGVVLGSSQEGKISAAARADYALAAAVVLTSDAPAQAGRVYELAGDTAFTMAQFAQEIAAQSGKEVVYKDLPQQAYQEALQGIGLPGPVAELIADSSACTAKGALFDDGRALSRLIGRPTTPIAETIAAGLQAAA